MAKLVIQFKDADFVYRAEDGGVNGQACAGILDKAEFGEYFSLELTLDNESGKITEARFVK